MNIAIDKYNKLEMELENESPRNFTWIVKIVEKKYGQSSIHTHIYIFGWDIYIYIYIYLNPHPYTLIYMENLSFGK